MRGISYVLAGAVLGAIISSIASASLVVGVRSGTKGLTTPWLVAADLFAAGAVVTFAIRIDPIEIARRANFGMLRADDPTRPSRPLGELVRLPTVSPALSAAVVSQAVMASFMSIVGLVMVNNGHDLAAVAVSISVHFVGMFGLCLLSAASSIAWGGSVRSALACLSSLPACSFGRSVQG